MTTGGSIQEINIAGRSFAATADADAARKLGGNTSTLEANGDGSVRKIMIRGPWMLEGVVLECDNDRGDQEILQDVADNPNLVAISATTADQTTYEGVGTVVGDLVYNSATATVATGLGGQGKLAKQL